MRKSPYLAEILRLDPARDYQRIVYLDTCFEFPWDTTRSLELAFFRTYGVPSMSALLDRTGEFARRPQKRYDDSDLILSTLGERGLDSAEGKDVLRKMNEIHRRFEIANDDFLYVLSTLLYEPIRWNARFGWRPLVAAEKEAAFHFWCDVGRRMAIREIPPTYGEFERFNLAYERDRYRFAEANRRVATATRDMFLRWFPWLPRRLGAAAVHALMDDALLRALGLPPPPAPVRRAVESALRARAALVRALPPRRGPRLRTSMRRRSYPRGYTIDDLGPSSGGIGDAPAGRPVVSDERSGGARPS